MEKEAERERSTGGWGASLILALGLLSSCGAGVAAVVASSGSSGGGTTPALTAFAVPEPKVSPARVTLEASTAIQVEMQFSVAGGREFPMSFEPAPGISGNRVQLAAGANELEWNFAADLGRTGLTPDVTLRATRDGAPVEGGELAHLAMGNDAPVVLAVEPLPSDPSDPEESTGIVELRITLRDSSSDLVDLTVEWRRASDPADAWNPASFAGAPPGGVETNDTGRESSFFWNTNLDLGDQEAAVFFRVTPHDRTDEGEPFLTEAAQPAFRVDNNAEPSIQLLTELVITNPDERRGIPIPFRVFDEEGDLVETIFQWRREGEEFPALPLEDAAALDAILADPAQRAAHHVCTPYPRFAHGRALPVDSTTIRLPELALGESWVLHAGLAGRTLELLRPPEVLVPVTATWNENPLVAPVAALPLQDGLIALVLEEMGQLREIELATGRLVREVASGSGGIPTAMAFERGEKAVLVATDLGGVARIVRVELASGAVTELVAADGSVQGPVRGLASLGTEAFLFTAGTALWFVDTRDPPGARVAPLLSDLAEPWGVVVDPLPPHRAFLAERGANRVLALDLDSHGGMPVAVRTNDLAPAALPRPSALALERRGSRLLAVTEPVPGSFQLVALELGAVGSNVAREIGSSLPGTSANLTNGEEDLRLVVVQGAAELHVAGGIEQRRGIAALPAYDPPTQRVVVTEPFAPRPRPGQHWRIADTLARLPASTGGLSSAFLWDSSTDLPDGGSAFLRALARDTEAGVAVEGAAAKRLRAALEVEPLALDPTPAFDRPLSVAAADLDGDGDLELLAANFSSDRVTVFFQDAPGSFGAPALALDPTPALDQPVSVAAADLDGDGDLEVLAACGGSDRVTVFFQDSPGNFSAPALALDPTLARDGPSSVAAADLDGDGDLELLAANGFSDRVTVFLQDSPGSFGAPALALDPTPADDAPVSVVAADLDGDGDLELLAANVRGDRVTVFFQDAPGNFGAPALSLDPTPANDGPNSVAAADLDGDGDLEILAANGSDRVTVFFQDLPGSFGMPALALDPTPVFDGPSSVSAADMDGDGELDLLNANGSSQRPTIFFQDSPGGFVAPALALASPFVDNDSVGAADMDGDGDLELLAANVFSDRITVFFQDSPGSFGAPALALDPTLDIDRPASVAAADMDGDGDLEFIAANSLSDLLTVFFQDPLRDFAAPALALDPTPGFIFDEPVSVAAADLDGDGDLELIAACRNSDRLTVFFQDSLGSFAAPALSLDPTPADDSPGSVAAADIDGDGDLELIAANALSDRVTVFFQDSPGSFRAPALALDPTPALDQPVSVAAADLDGDGDLELIAANALSDRVTVFFQDSPGSFGAPAIALDPTPADDDPVSVAAADLDDDGDLELIATNRSSDRVTVFFQDSPGRFGAPALALDPTPAADFPQSVAAADLDGDGDLELLVANSNSDGVTVFFQDLPGSFRAPALALDATPAFDGPVSIAAADLDGDGDPELLAANSNSDRLTVFWGGR